MWLSRAALSRAAGDPDSRITVQRLHGRRSHSTALGAENDADVREDSFALSAGGRSCEMCACESCEKTDPSAPDSSRFDPGFAWGFVPVTDQKWSDAQTVVLSARECAGPTPSPIGSPAQCPLQPPPCSPTALSSQANAATASRHHSLCASKKPCSNSVNCRQAT
jgi:hypothetical protein